MYCVTQKLFLPIFFPAVSDRYICGVSAILKSPLPTPEVSAAEAQTTGKIENSRKMAVKDGRRAKNLSRVSR